MHAIRVAVTSALAAALLAAALPAQAMTMGMREYTCPINGKRFKARVAMSGTSFGMRLDTRRIGPIASPWTMPVCPGSGFPLYKRKFSAEERAKLKKLAATPEYAAVRRANTTYFLAAWVQEKMGAKPFRVALYYLRATWQAEGGDKVRHRRYLETTLRRLEAHLAGADMKQRQSHFAVLLAANTERRLGRYDAAIKRINAAWRHLPANQLRKVAAQIRQWAKRQNADPQRYVAARKR